MLKYLACVAIVTLVSCKTTSRADFTNEMTSILIRLPETLREYDSQLSLSRIDSKAEPKVVRGGEIQLRLPKGEYNLELKLRNKSGTEEYQLCENSRKQRFLADREEPILDLCGRIDNRFVTRTLATTIVTPRPSVVPPVGPSENIVVDPEPPEPIPTPTPTPMEPKPPIDLGPLFIQEPSCFGLETAYSQESEELVIKTAKSIADYTIDNGNFPRCKITILVKKELNKVYQPLSYSVKFSGTEDTLAKNLFMTVIAKDDTGLTALPCKTTVLSTTANSGLASPCAFYSFTATGEQIFKDKDKLAYEKSCKAETKQMTLEFVVVGNSGTRIEDLKVPEIRIGIPKTEDCRVL